VRPPQLTYQFTVPTDVAGQTLQFLNKVDQRSGGAALDEFFLIDVPKDKILILTNATLAAVPGATQSVSDMSIQGVSGTGEIFDIARRLGEVVADEDRTLNWSGELWIAGAGAGNASLRFFNLFSAVANANLSRVGFSGFIIPRGNAGAF